MTDLAPGVNVVFITDHNQAFLADHPDEEQDLQAHRFDRGTILRVEPTGDYVVQWMDAGEGMLVVRVDPGKVRPLRTFDVRIPKGLLTGVTSHLNNLLPYNFRVTGWEWDDDNVIGTVTGWGTPTGGTQWVKEQVANAGFDVDTGAP